MAGAYGGSGNYFWICGNASACIFRSSRYETGAGEPGNRVCAVQVSGKRSRIVVIGFLFANLFSILFSLAGAALSLLCMTAAKRFSGLSIVGVSILGGVTHNLGQLIVAALVVENGNVFYYFPALLISGLVTGALIGIVTGEILKRTTGRKSI